MNDFVKHLHSTVIPQSICLGTHIFCASSLIYYVYSQRRKTPIIQNSPYLTISAQIMLVFSSLCLFLGKVSYTNYEKYDTPYDIVGPGCYGNINDGWLIALNCLHTFFLEFMYVSYLLKMIRVLLITFRRGLITNFTPFFSSQTKLIVFSFMWAALMSGVDILMKIFMHGADQNRIHLYPQFNQFLCDVELEEQYKWPAFSISQGKMCLYLLLFAWSFTKSYALQQIDDDLRLRRQYYILLLLPFSVILTDKILKLVNLKYNTAMPVHYVDCISNLTTGLLLMWSHFDVAKAADFSLPEENDLRGQIDLYYVFGRREIKEALRGYFVAKGRGELFKVQEQLLDPNNNHSQQTQQKLQNILNGLTNEEKKEVERNPNKMYESGKTTVENTVQRMITEWKQTVSGKAISNKMEKNGKYFERMKKLNLVVSQSHPQNYTSIVYSN